MTLQGIDVSHYQPGVDWSKVAKSCAFAFAKVSEGVSGTDSLFPTYWPQMKACGLIRGGYHFLQPQQDPVLQAQHFLRQLGPLQPGDLPPVLDLEVTAGMSYAAVARCAQLFLSEIEDVTKVTPWIYSSLGFLEALQLGPQFARYPLWIAAYRITQPAAPHPWSRFEVWQYSEHGIVSGVPGPCDRNIFDGSITDLRALTIPQLPPAA